MVTKTEIIKYLKEKHNVTIPKGQLTIGFGMFGELRCVVCGMTIESIYDLDWVVEKLKK